METIMQIRGAVTSVKENVTKSYNIQPLKIKAVTIISKVHRQC